MSDDVLTQLAAVKKQMAEANREFREGLHALGEELRGSSEVTRQELVNALQRQDLRHQAWTEGVEARLVQYQERTGETLDFLHGVLQSHLNTTEQQYAGLRQELTGLRQEFGERIARLEKAS